MLLHRFLSTFRGPWQALLSLRRAFATQRRARSGGAGAPNARSTSVMLGDWLRRYGLAECAGTGCALLATFIARRLSRRLVIAAYAAAWGETVGYGGAVFLRDLATSGRGAPQRRTKSLRGVVLGLLAEFGPAGALDTLVTRPFMMAMGVRALGPVRGVIAGKLVADVVFYVPVILVYERRKRRPLDNSADRPKLRE
jgi:hypothetical protein